LLDNVAAAREGTRHLISLGHRHILLLASDPSLGNVQERIEGYREALAEAGLSEFENVVVAGCNEAEHARQALGPALSGPGRPSALFAVTQIMTIGALQSQMCKISIARHENDDFGTHLYAKLDFTPRRRAKNALHYGKIRIKEGIGSTSAARKPAQALQPKSESSKPAGDSRSLFAPTLARSYPSLAGFPIKSDR
jgi:hypothetical protein